MKITSQKLNVKCLCGGLDLGGQSQQKIDHCPHNNMCMYLSFINSSGMAHCVCGLLVECLCYVYTPHGTMTLAGHVQHMQ